MAAIGGALAVVLLGGLVVVLVALFPDELQLGSSFGPYEPISEPGSEVAMGQCLSGDPPDAVVTNQSDVVDCGQRHGSEVIGTFVLPGLSQAPRGDDFETFVDAGCLVAFEGYIGRDWEDSDLNYGSRVPSAKAWKNGDRTVFCLLTSAGFNKGRGSAQGSRA